MNSFMKHARPSRVWPAGLVLASALGLAAVSGVPAQAGAPSKRVISAGEAPAAIGPYSQGIASGNTVYVSGQLPIDPAVGKVDKTHTVSEQTARSITNIEAVLRAESLGLENVVSTTVYLADMASFSEFNKVYAEHFGTDSAPARATVEVAELPQGASVEISAIAVR